MRSHGTCKSVAGGYEWRLWTFHYDWLMTNPQNYVQLLIKIVSTLYPKWQTTIASTVLEMIQCGPILKLQIRYIFWYLSESNPTTLSVPQKVGPLNRANELLVIVNSWFSVTKVIWFQKRGLANTISTYFTRHFYSSRERKVRIEFSYSDIR